MIAKSYSVKLLQAVFGGDLEAVSKLGYPKCSGYCRGYSSGYRTSPDIMLLLDIDIAQFTLHCIHASHPGEYQMLKAKYRDGRQQSRNELNRALRVFRSRFQIESASHQMPMSAV